MTNNDVLRSVRYMLNLSDAQVVSILARAESEVSEAEVHSLLKKKMSQAIAPAPMSSWVTFLMA